MNGSYEHQDHMREITPTKEIPPRPVFREACLQEYFVHPEFLSVSILDMKYVTAKKHVAAARDLLHIRDRVTDEIAPLIDKAIDILVDVALDLSGPEAVEEMDRQLELLAEELDLDFSVGGEGRHTERSRGYIRTQESVAALHR